MELRMCQDGHATGKESLSYTLTLAENAFDNSCSIALTDKCAALCSAAYGSSHISTRHHFPQALDSAVKCKRPMRDQP